VETLHSRQKLIYMSSAGVYVNTKVAKLTILDTLSTLTNCILKSVYIRVSRQTRISRFPSNVRSCTTSAREPWIRLHCFQVRMYTV
jgi:hypothetical protein